VLGRPGGDIHHVNGGDRPGDVHPVAAPDADRRVVAAVTAAHAVAFEAAPVDHYRVPPVRPGGRGFVDQHPVPFIAFGGAADQFRRVPEGALMVDHPPGAPAQVGAAADVAHVPRV